ncbi:MAG: hypothetical protein J1F71_05190 [Clostridiales bacterium]|nr:hypothetical protein [Clostridiales bacterium]
MPENINIKSDQIAWIARGQAVVEARQPINSDAKILSAYATAVVNPSEIFAGEVRYVGKVTFDLVVSVDGAINTVTAVAEFSDKITSPQITAGTSATLMPEVINVEATVEGGTLKAVAVVDTSVIAVVDTQESLLSQPDEGIYAEKRVVSYSTLSAEESETLYITDSVGMTGVTEVLSSVGRAVVTGVECLNGEIKTSGAVYTFAVVRSDDTVSSLRIITPFVKSIAAPVHDGDTAFVFASVTDSSATPISGENRIEVAATLRLNAIALTSVSAEVVTDVFCADNEIEKTEKSVKCITAGPLTTVIDTVDGQIPIEADRLAADNVLCVTGTFCQLTSAKIEDRRVNVEGLVGGDIVYYNAEHNATDVLSFRLPFSMPLANHTDAEDVTAFATVTDVNVKVRRESVFDIKAEVAFTLFLSTATEISCISAVEKGEPLARPDASVIIHITRDGETLWQAAKALCCSPERVTEQNSATPPYSEGQRLINFCNK